MPVEANVFFKTVDVLVEEPYDAIDGDADLGGIPEEGALDQAHQEAPILPRRKGRWGGMLLYIKLRAVGNMRKKCP